MTAIVTDAHYRMSVSLIRDLFDRGVRVAACEKASIEAPIGFASRGTAQCVRLPDVTSDVLAAQTILLGDVPESYL